MLVTNNAHTHIHTKNTCVYYLHMGHSIPARRLLQISLFPLGYNQQLSASQIHKQSFVLLHQFFQVSEKEKKRKNRSSGRDFVLLSIRILPLSAEQTPRRRWRPSRVYGRNSSQVLMIT